MTGILSDSSKDGIRTLMDEVTADPHKIPGCVAVVVDRDGKTLFSHASGKKGIDTKEPMTLDAVFWIASCTKMIGGIAAMQLVEQGKLALDDADLVERYCPELKTVRILKGFDENGKAETVAKKNRITLRMLLSHTAGFEYDAADERGRNASSFFFWVSNCKTIGTHSSTTPSGSMGNRWALTNSTATRVESSVNP